MKLGNLLSCCLLLQLTACTVRYPATVSHEVSAEILGDAQNSHADSDSSRFFVEPATLPSDLPTEGNASSCHWDAHTFHEKARQTNSSADFLHSPEYQAYLACRKRQNQSQVREYLQRIAVVATRSELARQSPGSVYLTPPKKNLPGLYRITVQVTEVNDAVEGNKSQEDNLQRQLGWGLGMAAPYATSAASFLGPLGGILTGFDAITGIPIRWRSAEKIGKLSIEFSVHDPKSGQILLSLPSEATFRAEARALGDTTIGTHAVNIRGSYAEDAAFVAAREGVKKVISRFKEHFTGAFLQ